MTLSPATAPGYVDTCNLSATSTHYTDYDNLGPTAAGTWAPGADLSTGAEHFRSDDNLGLTATDMFPCHDDLFNRHAKLAHRQRSNSDRQGPVPHIRNMAAYKLNQRLRARSTLSWAQADPLSDRQRSFRSLGRDRCRSAPRPLQIPCIILARENWRIHG